MKALKVIAIVLAMFIIGTSGIYLLFSECENMVLLLLSKPLGLGLLCLTYILQNELKRVTIYNSNH